MPIRVNLDALHAAVRAMGAKPGRFELAHTERAGPVIDIQLEHGIELPDLKDVEFDGGLLGYKGRQILLYIQDHSGSRLRTALQDGSQGNKFHVADCSTLQRMRSQNRFERYRVTNNLSGSFYIDGTDWETGEHLEGQAMLDVCQNCLKLLNYKRSIDSQAKRLQVVREFDIEEFFSVYSSFFSHLPSRRAGEEQSKYDDEWPKISSRAKASVAFRCQNCGVDLKDHKGLLHVHHRNGVKSDNRSENLRVLCAVCHRKEPSHEHLFVPLEQTQLITNLQRQQGSLAATVDWEVALKFVDPALEGALRAAQREGISPPEIGYEIQDASQAVVAQLEAAWPKERLGVAVDATDATNAKAQGWRVLTMIEVVTNPRLLQ